MRLRAVLPPPQLGFYAGSNAVYEYGNALGNSGFDSVFVEHIDPDGDNDVTCDGIDDDCDGVTDEEQL